MEDEKWDWKESFKGGKLTITHSQIEIYFLGIKEIYKIGKPPYEEDGEKKMQSNGLIFERDNTHTLTIEF